MTVTQGQRFSRGDGHYVRVDFVANGQVYYVAWRPGQEFGNPIRMDVETFLQLLEEEGMVERK